MTFLLNCCSNICCTSITYLFFYIYWLVNELAHTLKKEKRKKLAYKCFDFLTAVYDILFLFFCHMGNMKYLFEDQQKLTTKSNVTKTTIFTIVELAVFIDSHLCPSLISLYHLPFTACHHGSCENICGSSHIGGPKGDPLVQQSR